MIDLLGQVNASGLIAWDVPEGNWTLLRFGHTITGAMIQLAQWAAPGLECDKRDRDAVAFHGQHRIDELKRNLGDLIGNPLTTFYCDGYEAGTPICTPEMRQNPFVPGLRSHPVAAGADRTAGSEEKSAHFKKGHRSDDSRPIQALLLSDARTHGPCCRIEVRGRTQRGTLADR